MITLGVLTGVSPLVWAEMGGRAISTAFAVLKLRYQRNGQTPDDSGDPSARPPVYSG